MQKFLPSLLTLMPPPPHFFLWHEKLKIRCTLYRWLWWHVLSYKQKGKLRSSSVSQLRTRRSGSLEVYIKVWHLSKQDSVLSLKQDSSSASQLFLARPRKPCREGHSKGEEQKEWGIVRKSENQGFLLMSDLPHA